MLLLSRSLRRKLLATGLSALVFTLLYQATVFDSLSFGDGGIGAMAAPDRGARATFSATAYCRGITTASGIKVRAGIAASDPQVLPIGSVIQVDGVGEAYRGIYTVLDTGPEIQGRELDLYIWNCDEAVQFGRRQATVTVLRRGWNDGQAPARDVARR